MRRIGIFQTTSYYMKNYNFRRERTRRVLKGRFGSEESIICLKLSAGFILRNWHNQVLVLTIAFKLLDFSEEVPILIVLFNIKLEMNLFSLIFNHPPLPLHFLSNKDEVYNLSLFNKSSLSSVMV